MMKILNNLTNAFFAVGVVFTACPVASCMDSKPTNARLADPIVAEEDVVADSTIYGTCGENTAMSSLELITDAGDTLRFFISDTDEDVQTVQGGMLAGDRMAVVAGESIDGERYANKIINLTTLQGHWTSLDKNFEIQEGGEVRSDVKAEHNPWTSWKILNGHLLLNRDTFDIRVLGNDTLSLENGQGIFVYKRL